MPEQSVPSPSPRPAIVGHRGASAHAPENTLAAFRRALEDGAQLLECDVHLSADGHVVVMHDETIDRTAAEDSPLRTGAIGNLTRAELDTVLLEGEERIPSLAELFEMTTAPLFIEVKVAAAATAVAGLLRTLPSGTPAAASTVISFHAAALAEESVAPPVRPSPTWSSRSTSWRSPPRASSARQGWAPRSTGSASVPPRPCTRPG